MTKVSIIIPVYNSEKYLKKCLDSVCNQALEDVEIIVINDASTDKSLDIIKSYEKQDSRIKLINMSENKGPGAARNIGINIANGRYVGFVDSDDYIDPHMFLELYNGCVQQNIDITSCNFTKEICGINYNQLLHKATKDSEKNTIIELQTNPSYLCEASVMCWDKLYNHDFIEKFSFPEELKYEDYPMVINMLGSADRILTLDRSLYHYRIRPNSITTSDNRTFKINTLDIFSCNDLIKKYYTENDLMPIFEETLNKIFLLHLLARLPQILTVNMSPTKKKELINYYINLIEIEFPNWRTNAFYLEKKNSSIKFGPCMSFIEKFFLDDNLRQETSKRRVKEKITNLCKK